MRILMKIFLLFALVFPANAFANMMINEVAWMGNNESSANEWIELKNTSASAVSLEGWTLTSNGKSPSIALSSCEIGANGFLLLERTDDDSTPAVSADMIYTGGLSNSGERIALQNALGDEVDFAGNVSGDWQAGENETKNTMQRDGAGWVTAERNPQNALEGFGCQEEEEEAEAENASSTDSQEDDDASAEGMDTEASDNNEVSTHSSAAPLTDFEKELEIVADVGRERAASVGTEIVLEGRAENENGRLLKSADYIWSFGDGTEDEGRKVRHTYQFAGEYNVVLNVEYQGARAVDRTSVSVSDVLVEVSDAKPGKTGYIEVENLGTQELNLGGGKLVSDEEEFLFPKDTIMKAGRSVRFANVVTGLISQKGDEVVLEQAQKKYAFSPEKDSVGVKGTSTTRNTFQNTKLQVMQEQLAVVKSDLSNTLEQMREGSDRSTRDTFSSQQTSSGESQSALETSTLREDAEETKNFEASDNQQDISQKSQKSSSAETIVVEKPTSWWQKALNWFAF